MKVNIDEGTFNKAISQGKLELAEWFLENACPVNDTAYIQNFNIGILNWLNSKNIFISKQCLSNVIDRTGDAAVVQWFIDNGVVIDGSALISCIRNTRNELLWDLMKISKISLCVDAFRAAIMAENIDVLDFLKTNKCKTDETVTEIAMKYKKKLSLKWLVMNDMF